VHLNEFIEFHPFNLYIRKHLAFKMIFAMNGYDYGFELKVGFSEVLPARLDGAEF